MLLIISVDCGFAQAQPSQSTAENSPPDCFLNAVTVLQEIISNIKLTFLKAPVYTEALLFYCGVFVKNRKKRKSFLRKGEKGIVSRMEPFLGTRSQLLRQVISVHCLFEKSG